MINHGKYYGKVEDFLEDGYEIWEVLEGTLTDNYLIWNDENCLVLVERYVNEWTSCYTLYEGNAEESFDFFASLRDGMEEN